MRVYSNYSQSEEKVIATAAQNLGFSLSAFQHYCVMLYVGGGKVVPKLNVLTQTMFRNLNSRKRGETFIVSALLPDEWPDLSRSDKMTLSKQLSRHIKANQNQYDIKREEGKTTVYKKK